jgi:hypothetical protein
MEKFFGRPAHGVLSTLTGQFWAPFITQNNKKMPILRCGKNSSLFKVMNRLKLNVTHPTEIPSYLYTTA